MAYVFGSDAFENTIKLANFDFIDGRRIVTPDEIIKTFRSNNTNLSLRILIEGDKGTRGLAQRNYLLSLQGRYLDPTKTTLYRDLKHCDPSVYDSDRRIFYLYT